MAHQTYRKQLHYEWITSAGPTALRYKGKGLEMLWLKVEDWDSRMAFGPSY
jgi:hypothetical protein